MDDHAFAIIARIEAQVGSDDRLFDGVDHLLFPGLHEQGAGIAGVDPCYLRQRYHGSVVIHHHGFQHAWIGGTSSDLGQLVFQMFHGVVHVLFALGNGGFRIDHGNQFLREREFKTRSRCA